MDDLSGLDWSTSGSTSRPTAKPTLAAQSAAFASSYPSLRPTPPPPTAGTGTGSGRNTPLSMLSSQASGASAGPGSRNTPLSAAAAAAKATAQDSFSGLINFGAAKNTANLSLRERQERLDAEKRRKDEERRRQHQANYGDGQFFDALGRGSAVTGGSSSSRSSSPTAALAVPPVARRPSPLAASASTTTTKATADDDADLFAAFQAETRVDNASHFPPPTASHSGKSTPGVGVATLDLSNPNAWAKSPTPSVPAGTSHDDDDDDDDPFGLNQFQNARTTAAPVAASGGVDDDDFLGDLGKPVEEVRRKTEVQRRQQQQQQQQRTREPEPGKPIEDSDSDSDSDARTGADPSAGHGDLAATGNAVFDHAVAQLVDYGFSPADARRGLAESGRGNDVQAAVNYLLDDAHRKAKEKVQGRAGGQGGGRARAEEAGAKAAVRAPSRSRGPESGPDDFAKTAAAMGTSFLKTANSLWKTGQKQLQKAVQDFQQETDPSQPRWMRTAAAGHDYPPDAPDDSRRRHAHAATAANASSASSMATDEAMMLESGARPERRPHSAQPSAPPVSVVAEPRFSDGRASSHAPSRTQSPASSVGAGSAAGRNSPLPRWQQGGSSADPRARLTRQVTEEESAHVYVSPARRRKAGAAAAAAKPEPAPAPAPAVEEGDLLSNSTALPRRPAPAPASASAPASTAISTSQRNAATTPRPRPAATPRAVPHVNSLVLRASAQHRADGAAHFRRGDYAAAHAAYAASLQDIPTTHPLRAVLLANRALTALKTGDPRQAVADADAALVVIGPGRGDGESVALEDGTGATRDLRDLYGKALTRKAEALEQMEKWAAAGEVWQQCVEDGVASAAAMAGRQRCQTALRPKPKSKVAAVAAATSTAAARRSPAAAVAAATASATPTSASGRDFAAVQRLRAANEAAAREDAEKVALADRVDAQIAAWRDGKKDNLRALLGSLDKVLWAGSGWKPVGLHELVMPARVKIIYMKAIAKTHPDKIAPDASTEVRMIAGTVFATLNESWDKFKADNKM